MSKTNRIPDTNNPDWGFFGTMASQHGNAVAATTWQVAGGALVATLKISPEDARLALDSVVGRHLADRVNHLTRDLVALNREVITVAVLIVVGAHHPARAGLGPERRVPVLRLLGVVAAAADLDRRVKSGARRARRTDMAEKHIKEPKQTRMEQRVLALLDKTAEHIATFPDPHTSYGRATTKEEHDRLKAEYDKLMDAYTVGLADLKAKFVALANDRARHRRLLK